MGGHRGVTHDREELHMATVQPIHNLAGRGSVGLRRDVKRLLARVIVNKSRANFIGVKEPEVQHKVSVLAPCIWSYPDWTCVVCMRGRTRGAAKCSLGHATLDTRRAARRSSSARSRTSTASTRSIM